MKTPAIITGAFLFLFSLLLTACESEIDPNQDSSIESVQQTAEAMMISGDLEAAAQTWEQVLEADPNNPSADFQLALILLILDPETALLHLQAAEDGNANLSKQVTRLRAAIRQATVIDDRAYQLTIAGQALSSLEEWYLAEKALDMAVTENPDYAEAWAYLGEARQQTGSPGGLEALQTAFAIDPESFAVNLLLSIYYRRSQQPHVAISYLQTALSKEPTNLDLNADLAQTLIDAGRVQQGFDLLLDLTGEDTEDTQVWLKLAQLSVENNLQVAEDGLPAARRAVILAPENPLAAELLGRAYLLLDQPILAERFLTQASELAPQRAEPHYYLGILFINTTDYPSAEAELRSALSLAEESSQDLLVDQIKKLLSEYFP